MSGIIKKNTSRSSGIIGTTAAASSDLSGDSSPQLGGFLDANGNYIQMQKGGDISSASPCVITTSGDFFAVTGTTNFSAFTVAADRHFFLEFGGALTMTHGNGTLDLPGGANITTAASDVGEFVSTAANVVTCVNYTKRDGTAVVAASGTIIGASDYEHGTFSPTISCGDNSHSYTYQYGFYFKLGQIVFGHGYVEINSAGSSSGGCRLHSFPLTSRAEGTNYGSWTCHNAYSLAITAGHNIVGGRIDLNDTGAQVSNWDSTTGTSTFLFSELTAGGNFYFTFQYEVEI
jgi:hypothetical protein